MTLHPDQLDHLARFLDGFDDDAAEDARKLASALRSGLITSAQVLLVLEYADGEKPQVDRRGH